MQQVRLYGIKGRIWSFSLCYFRSPSFIVLSLSRWWQSSYRIANDRCNNHIVYTKTLDVVKSTILNYKYTSNIDRLIYSPYLNIIGFSVSDVDCSMRGGVKIRLLRYEHGSATHVAVQAQTPRLWRCPNVPSTSRLDNLKTGSPSSLSRFILFGSLWLLVGWSWSVVANRDPYNWPPRNAIRCLFVNILLSSHLDHKLSSTNRAKSLKSALHSTAAPGEFWCYAGAQSTAEPEGSLRIQRFQSNWRLRQSEHQCRSSRILQLSAILGGTPVCGNSQFFTDHKLIVAEKRPQKKTQIHTSPSSIA